MRWEFQDAANSDQIEQVTRALDSTRRVDSVNGESRVLEAGVLETRESVNGELRSVVRDWIVLSIETGDLWSSGLQFRRARRGISFDWLNLPSERRRRIPPST